MKEKAEKKNNTTFNMNDGQDLKQRRGRVKALVPCMSSIWRGERRKKKEEAVVGVVPATLTKPSRAIK